MCSSDLHSYSDEVLGGFLENRAPLLAVRVQQRVAAHPWRRAPQFPPEIGGFFQAVVEAEAAVGRMAEVLNRVRPLTLEMIRRLAAGLDLPAEVLIRGYGLRRAA